MMAIGTLENKPGRRHFAKTYWTLGDKVGRFSDWKEVWFQAAFSFLNFFFIFFIVLAFLIFDGDNLRRA